MIGNENPSPRSEVRRLGRRRDVQWGRVRRLVKSGNEREGEVGGEDMGQVGMGLLSDNMLEEAG